MFVFEDIKGLSYIYGSSVLHLRGLLGKPTKQPIVSKKTSNILLYNGEIFDSNMEFDFSINDGI